MHTYERSIPARGSGALVPRFATEMWVDISPSPYLDQVDPDPHFESPDDWLDPEEECSARSAYGHACAEKAWPPHEVHTCGLPAEPDAQPDVEPLSALQREHPSLWQPCGYEWVEEGEG